MRVVIKKWNEGDRFVGANIDDDGIMYIIYPDILYVEYGEPVEEPDATVRVPIIGSLGPRGTRLTSEQMHSGNIPQGLRAIEFDKAGIPAYDYLDLR